MFERTLFLKTWPLLGGLGKFGAGSCGVKCALLGGSFFQKGCARPIITTC